MPAATESKKKRPPSTSSTFCCRIPEELSTRLTAVQKKYPRITRSNIIRGVMDLGLRADAAALERAILGLEAEA